MEIEGKTVEYDRSGIGHCWVDAEEWNCPASIREEIETEIVEGTPECEDYVASNGQHYRW